MEIRLAKREDLYDLKEVWKLCFGDPDAYIDLYFDNRDWTREIAALEVDGKAVAMLAMIPVDMVNSDGEIRCASMIFAVATHPDYQKQGFADRLLEYANQYLFSKGTQVTLLVPAGEDLFQFYGKRGYQNGFFVREAMLKRRDIERMNRDESNVNMSRRLCRIVSSHPSQYNELRSKLLEGHDHLAYRVDEIRFEKQIAVAFGTDIYAIEFTGSGSQESYTAEGCAYAERVSPERVIVKELLVSEEGLAAALKCIAELLPAEEYYIRTPAHSGVILGGTIRPFGMVRANKADGRQFLIDPCFMPAESYLGIAYD